MKKMSKRVLKRRRARVLKAEKKVAKTLKSLMNHIGAVPLRDHPGMKHVLVQAKKAHKALKKNRYK